MGENRNDRTSDIDEQIARRFEMKRRLGKGAYGIVWKAMDRKKKDIVAVKKIYDAFRNQTDAQRTFREIMFLQAFRGHPNIIKLRGLHKAANNRDMYLVFDYMDTDLHHVIKKGNILKDIHKKYIMYQLLRATRFLHSGNVIHRDQKPSNVLINTECKVKLADFGLARSVANCSENFTEAEGHPLLTDYVATRWYRAPEILVASKRYTKGVDMWSLGCILAEMLLGTPLFPGTSTVHQLELIMAALPSPTPQEINNICQGYGRGLLEDSSGPKTSLHHMIKCDTEDAMDLVTRLVVFDPTKRLNATQAMVHPYVLKFYDGKERWLDHSVIPLLNDDIRLSVSEYRNKLYELMGVQAHCRNPSPAPGVRGPSPLTHRVRPRSPDHTNKKCLVSPQHKHQVPPTQSRNDKNDWNKAKSNAIATQNRQPGINTRQKLEKGNRSADHGDGSGLYKPQTVLCSSGHSPHKQKNGSQDRLRQGHYKVGRITQLPKVQQIRDYSKQNGNSPPSVTSYNQSHGILTSAALQDIRAVLKH